MQLLMRHVECNVIGLAPTATAGASSLCKADTVEPNGEILHKSAAVLRSCRATHLRPILVTHLFSML